MPSSAAGAADRNAKIRAMRRASLIFLTAVLLLPLAAHADDVDIPELGVRVTALPSVFDSTPPR